MYRALSGMLPLTVLALLITLSNINQLFPVFQRHFYRSREQSLDVGSILSPRHVSSEQLHVSHASEEKQSLRQKLSNLELELKASELVKKSSSIDNLQSSADENCNPSSAQKQPLIKKRSSNLRDAHRLGDCEPRRSSKDSSERKSTDPSSKDDCIMCIQEKSEISVRADPVKASTNESSVFTSTDQSEAEKQPGRSSFITTRKAGRIGASEQRTANKRIVSDCLDNRLDARLDARVQRSKSDAQNKVTNEDFVSDTNVKVKHNRIGSKIIKRSMSFNRIFNYSMLSRSKEYRL